MFTTSHTLQTWDFLLKKVLECPGTKVNRNEWLAKQLQPFGTAESLCAIASQVPRQLVAESSIERIAQETISLHVHWATALSSGSTLAERRAKRIGGIFDGMQYLANALILVQKLAYLYGWPDLLDHGKVTTETRSRITLLLGIALGVRAADSYVMKHKIKHGLDTPFSATPLPLKTASPLYGKIIQKVTFTSALVVGKTLLTGITSKSVPLLSTTASGAATYYSFYSQALRLRNMLRDISLDPAIANK